MSPCSHKRKLGCAKIGAIPYMAILAELTSDDVLDTAYDWLCRRRRNYPADADVWSLRRSWAEEKDRLKVDFAAGRYRFGLLTRVTLADGEEIDLWSARDGLVLKALAIVLVKRHIRRRYSRVPLPQARLGRITPRPIRSTAAKH